MAWVEFDRTPRRLETIGGGPLERGRSLRDRIHDQTCAAGYDRERNASVQ